jgi:hypothetical protein
MAWSEGTCVVSLHHFVTQPSQSTFEQTGKREKEGKMMARVRFVLVVIPFSAIIVFAGGVTSAHAINCGDVLGPGGRFQLQQDLHCSGLAFTANRWGHRGFEWAFRNVQQS